MLPLQSRSHRFIRAIDMKYEDYSLEDFLMDPFFTDWVKQPTEESSFFWQKWLANHPEKASVISEAKEIILSIGYDNQYNPSQKEFLEVLENIHKAEGDSSIHKKATRPQYFWRVAAGFLIFSAAFLAYLHYQDILAPDKPLAQKEEKPKWITKSTPRGAKLNLVLGDGTEIKLNSESVISFPKSFSNRAREVRLEGEAYFEVAEDEQRPFSVTSGNIVTTALGTSFNVRAYQEDIDLVVSLTSGKVVIKDPGNIRSEQVILAPYQQTTFNKDSGEFSLSQFSDKDISWSRDIIVFEDASFSEIRNTLERWYDVDFIIASSVMNRGFTGEFENQSLETVLEGISFSVGFSYEVQSKEKRVIIN